MMNDLQFDDFVKKQMSDHEAEVPPHVLENILSARKKSNPKVFLFWFDTKIALTACLLLLLGIGGYVFLTGKNTTTEKSANIRDNALTKESNTTLPASHTNNNKATPNDNITGLQKDDLNNPATGHLYTTAVNNPPAKTANSGAPHQYVLPGLTEQQSKINKESSDIYNDVNETITATNQKENTPAIVPGKEKGNTENSINKLSFPYTVTNAKELQGATKLNQKLYFPSCPSIEDDAAGNKKYWEVYAGPDFPIGVYKSVLSDSATNNYIQKRKESSKISSAFSLGVRYTKVFSNGMSARGGLNFSQINEKFKYFNPNEVKLVTVITTRVIVRSPGDTLYIKDTLQYQQSGTRIKTTYNRYRNIDIPLVLGYELGNGRLHANINAGIIINVYSWYKGDVLDTLYQPVSITTGKNSPYQFKTNIGVGFLGGVSLYYKITGKLHLLLEPYFRYNLSPMSNDKLNLQQKYHTIGVRTGLRFDLK